MKIGYARVSTSDQHLRMQEDALKSAGCEEIYTDVISGVKSQRPGLDKALNYAREGDTIVVWKLDRLGRSIQHLIQTITSLIERKIGFKSLQENIDTSTSGGKLIFHIFSALAEFERDLIRERTGAGRVAAKQRGVRFGRPEKMNEEQKLLAKRLLQEDKSVSEIAKTFNVHKATIYRLQDFPV